MSRNFEIMLEYEAVPGKRPTRAEYEAKLGSSISSKDMWPSFVPISNGARGLYKDFDGLDFRQDWACGNIGHQFKELLELIFSSLFPKTAFCLR